MIEWRGDVYQTSVGKRAAPTLRAHQEALFRELETSITLFSGRFRDAQLQSFRSTLLVARQAVEAGETRAALHALAQLAADVELTAPVDERTLMRGAILRLRNAVAHVPAVCEPGRYTRRTRCTADLALRLLSPVDRQRYREEWAAELGDLPRRDQAPYALRLLSRAWCLRRELSGRTARAPQVGLVVMVAIPGADAVAAFCGLGWPAAAVAISWGVGVGWTVSSKERTHNLVSLIKATRPGKAPEK